MAQRDAVIEKDSAIAPMLARTMTQGENMKHVKLVDFRGDANANRPPDYFMYIYNISPRSFEIPRPPNFPMIRLAACPTNEEEANSLKCPENELVRKEGKIIARKVARIQNIVNEKWTDADSGEVRVRGIQGERFAMDLLNPSNLGIDMWQEITDPGRSWLDNEGSDDMTRRGLFWTLNDPPTAEEIAKAKGRLEKHYRNLLRQADEYERDPQTRRLIGYEHHMAADYFHIRSTWHTVAELEILCEQCGDPLPRAGVAYHRNTMGVICVLDWKKAVEAGAKTMAEVPDSKKWATAKG